MAQRNKLAKHVRQRPSRAHGARAAGRTQNIGEDNVGFGFSAYHLLLGKVESLEQFERFRESLVRDLAPEGAVQYMLADRIVGNFWRLRHLAMLDRGLMNQNLGAEHKMMTQVGRGLLKRAMARGESVPLKPTDNEQEQAARDMVVGYLQGCFPHQEGWDVLIRYEAHLLKGVYDALSELLRLQRARRPGRRADFG